jgi:hypothetical protein
MERRNGDAMYLIQILLPLEDAKGKPFPPGRYDSLAQHLTDRFGGVTSFTRSPAEGRWKQGGETAHDEIVVMEVMIDILDRTWWADLRERLARDFRQDEIVIRCQPIERL